MFSYSLVISATSGEPTRCAIGLSASITRAAMSVHRGVTPPSTLGVSCWVWRTLPGSMRSGLDATKTSEPTVSPRSVSGSTSMVAVVPMKLVEVRMKVWPACAYRTSLSQASLSGPRSGSRRLSTGVGTQTMTASASASLATSVVSSKPLSPRAVARRSRSV
ncbi:hypothetical protein SBADM41S_04822 [Streptomyces badius]